MRLFEIPAYAGMTVRLIWTVIIEYLKKQGKLEKLVIPNRNKYSFLLRKFRHDMAFVDDLRRKVEYK